MPRQSAGILLYRFLEGAPQVFLVHPGGPFWANKDEAAWSIPKGEFSEDEEPLVAARREFAEETHLPLPAGEAFRLEPVVQPGGKIVHALAVEGDADPEALVSDAFELEWPPRSGRLQRFPEIDRAGWFSLDEARKKLHKGQVALIDQLERRLGISP